MVKYCKYCCNATVEPKLTPDNDLSYMSVGATEQEYSMFVRSGSNLPTAIITSRWSEKFNHNVEMGIYVPKFCPECGRRLIENEKTLEKTMQMEDTRRAGG